LNVLERDFTRESGAAGLTILHAVRVALVLMLGLAAAETLGGCSSSPRLSDGGADSGIATPALTLSEHVPAGQDLYRCAYLVASTADAFLTAVSHTATEGGHHVLLSRTDLAAIPDSGSRPVDCFADPSNPMQHMRAAIYGSQARAGSFAFPAGVGLPVRGGEVLLAWVHFINPGSAALDASEGVTLTSTTQGVPVAAGAFFFNDPFIDVAVAATSRAAMRCLIPNDITVIDVLPHTHARALTFAAFLDAPPSPPANTPFYYSADPTSPLPPTAPIVVAAGSRLRFTCTYQNRASQAYFQGLDDLTAEMCAFSGIYYPALSGQAESCALAPDGFGTGTATCAQALACVSACPAVTVPPSDFVGTASPGIDPCWQQCIVASCPSASAPLLALEQCAQGNCTAPCMQPASAACAACQSAQCAAQSNACASDPCGL
jgi:hypothetical protein